MAEPFLGEIRLFSFNFAPAGWAKCNGQLLPLQQNAALYTLLGTSYGGDGTTTFALPNLQGQVPIHPPAGAKVGQSGGEETHKLTIDEIPSHTHELYGSTDPASQKAVANNVWGTPATLPMYDNGTPSGTMSSQAIADAGGGAGHSNMQPYWTGNYCIALQGIFPPRN